MTTTTTSEQREQGCVKWFKDGYGFISMCAPKTEGPTEVFVHHSALLVGEEQYRYLVQGEYVDFEVSASTTGEKHKVQASRVSGIQGGKLMCETRRLQDQSQNQNQSQRPARVNNEIRTEPKQKAVAVAVEKEKGKEWQEAVKRPAKRRVQKE